AKGLMANADVTVLAVNADGSVGSTVLASGTTSATGAYNLSFTATAGTPYVVRVAAKADGSTTHLDEVLGTQPLPAGFALRALTVPTGSGTVSVSAAVTPFSEMAAAAASRATGGITATNAAQSLSTVSQLLGFNPLAAASPSTAATASTSAQQLAVMLTAVSKLAADGALGCTTGTAAEKTRCVTEALAASASTTSLKLQATGGVDVSAALGAAVTSVLATPALSGSVPASALTVAQANLACTGTACAAAPASGGTPPGPTATALAIASAKQLFTEIRSDFSSLFSRGGATNTATGSANMEAFKFRQAMDGVQVPAEVLAKSLGAVLMGIDHYNDYKAGRDTSNARGRAAGEFDTDTPSFSLDNFSGTACGVFSDSDALTQATSPADANYIGCRALYFVRIDPVTGVRYEWRHGFTLTPTGNGNFSYISRARQRQIPCVAPACTVPNGDFLDPAVSSGTITTTTDANGSITGFTTTGRLPSAFTEGSTTLHNGGHEWDLAGTRTISGFKQEVSTITGTMRALTTAGALQGTLTLRPGTTVTTMPVTEAGNKPTPADPAASGELSSGTLNLLWATPGAEFDGALTLDNGAWDASGTTWSPTRLVLTGSLKTITGTTAAEFLAGSFTGTFTGWGAHNATLPLSATNRYTETVSFVGSVTAPTRPRLELTVGGSKTSEQPDFTTLTLQYRSLVNGTPRIVVGATARLESNGEYGYELTETTSNLSLTYSELVTTSGLFQGTTRIGTLTHSNGLMTFVDGSFISLDTGL
ncbi:MAG: hypothetical protein RL227_1260, partial [Pseudomonadota bacterium]